MNLFHSKLINWRYISVRLAALSALAVLACPTQAQRAFEIDILRDTFGYHGDVQKSVKLSELDGQEIAFTAKALDAAGTLDYDFHGGKLGVTRQSDGSAQLTEQGSERVYAPVRLYWSAWYTFRPDTKLVGKS